MPDCLYDEITQVERNLGNLLAQPPPVKTFLLECLIQQLFINLPLYQEAW